MSSVEQNDSGDQLNRGEEISREFVVAGGNAAELLNFIEETLDEVALTVKHEIAFALGLAVRLGRDDWGDSPCCEAVDKPISVVRLIANEGPLDQRSRAITQRRSDRGLALG